MKRNRVDVITLGCSKNLVDSERLLKRFQDSGYEVAHDSDDVCGEIVIINTCGFIGDAKEESINTILEYVEAKNVGRISRLYVMGCLSERYLAELEDEIPLDASGNSSYTKEKYAQSKHSERSCRCEETLQLL